MFAAAYTPLDGWFLCGHLCLTLSDVHSGQWWVGRCSFFFSYSWRDVPSSLLQVSRSPLSLCPSCMPRLMVDEHWCLCSPPHPGCTLYSLEIYSVSKPFLPTWFFHRRDIFSSHVQRDMQVEMQLSAPIQAFQTLCFMKVKQTRN